MVVFLSRILRQPLGLFTIYSAGLVAWILWQGTAYWRLKLRAVQRDSEIGKKPPRRLGVFHNLPR